MTLYVPLNVAVAVDMLLFIIDVSTSLLSAEAALGISNRIASIASLSALSATYTPPDFTGLSLPSVGALSKVRLSCFD